MADPVLANLPHFFGDLLSGGDMLISVFLLLLACVMSLPLPDYWREVQIW